ncbi:MAG: PepSY-like domain-containing protein [Capnocytophaga sp.]|nr:PepSY-like domain-containing protein [Capnocytophaga sp.]
MVKLIKSMAVLVTLFGVQFANAQNNVIAFETLPAKAQSFVKEHFSVQEISGVYEDVEHLQQKEYSVYFNDGTEIEFFSNGDWEEVKSRKGQVPDKIVPTEIAQYVKKQYSQTQIKDIKKKRIGYEVELSNGLDLEFNKKGQFLRIDN